MDCLIMIVLSFRMFTQEVCINLSMFALMAFRYCLKVVCFQSISSASDFPYRRCLRIVSAKPMTKMPQSYELLCFGVCFRWATLIDTSLLVVRLAMFSIALWSTDTLSMSLPVESNTCIMLSLVERTARVQWSPWPAQSAFVFSGIIT